MNKLMNCIKKVLEKKEIKQTWLANKPGKVFTLSIPTFVTTDNQV